MNIVEHNLMNFLTSTAEREMHYIRDDKGVYYMLSLDTDTKIEDIKEDDNVEGEPYEGEDFTGTAVLVEDKDKIKEVFDIMTDNDANWFAELTDDIILIEVTPN